MENHEQQVSQEKSNGATSEEPKKTVKRSIYITGHGDYSVLKVKEEPIQHAGSGQVRVDVKAAGLNFAEVMARQGLYPDAPPTPCIVGYEAAGIIDEVGPDVKDLRVGMRVVAMIRFGSHSDSIVTGEKFVIQIPDEMSFEEAAAIPVNYLTAYHMIFRVGNLQPKDKVLIHMAAGGVGIAALQLCKTVPDVETFGTASASKHEIIRSYGCDHPIDYRTKDYATEIKKITNGGGVDMILDSLGGQDNEKGYRLLRPMGRLIVFGFANMSTGPTRSLWNIARQWIKVPTFNPLKLMDENRMVAGVNLGHLWDHIDVLRLELSAVLQLYKEGKVKPRVDKVFPFEKAGEAHAFIQERKNVGKVILVPR